METHFYYYDAAHALKPFAYALPGELGEDCALPDYALLAAPEERLGFWPVLNAAGDGWSYVEDHRQKKDARDRIIEGTGTPYWLVAEGDTPQSPARYMTDIGPLPEGAVLDKPRKTHDDLAIDLRSQRDTRIAATQWLMERHTDELANAGATTLSADQYAALLAYRQALRDMPQAEGFPWDGGGELTPWPVRPNAGARGVGDEEGQV